MTDTMIAPPAVMESLPEFLAMIQNGVGPKNAAIACNWTIRQLRDLEALPQFQEAMAIAKEQAIESIEQKAYELAKAGNVPMIQMILFCQAADKGWRPPTHRVAVQHGGTVVVEKIQATKAALLQIMQENGVGALALGGPLDGDIVDAEVVDDPQ